MAYPRHRAHPGEGPISTNPTVRSVALECRKRGINGRLRQQQRMAVQGRTAGKKLILAHLADGNTCRF
jgi:hypothetical protein